MDKKTIGLVVALGVLLFFYFDIMEALGLYTPYVPPVKETVVDSTTNQQAQYTENTQSTQSLSSVAPVTNAVEQADSTITEQAVEVVSRDTVIVETNKYIVTMSTFGGGPVSLKLKEFDYRNDTLIEMLPNAMYATPSASFAGGTYNTSQTMFASTRQAGTYDATTGAFAITYQFVKEDGSAIKKHYRFYPNTYHYDLDIELVEPHKMGLTGKYTLEWNTPLGVTEPQPQSDYEVMNAMTYQGGTLETLDDFEDGKLKQSLDGNTLWAGVRSKYFSAVLIPKNRNADAVSANGVINTISTNDEMIDQRLVTVGIDMPFANVVSITDSFTVFVGPLDYHMMSDYDVHLEDIMDIGTWPVVGWLVKMFAVPIMWLLPEMYKFVPNYGVVIILFALFVKLVTLPLSMKSFKSMNAMKEVQPQLEEVKKKYGKDPQRMQKETMKLYKEHGVNPISGCLPMLPQMPLFIAMFAVFRSTILLRDAPFFWIFDDLSRGATSYTDPYMILVLIMIGAQFISQKLTMGTGNQQNKMFGYIMPIMMGWMFHSFASGLVLYWAVFSLMSLVDYFLFKRKNLKNTNIKTA